MAMPWRCVTSCTPFGTLGEKKWKITSTNYQEVSQNEVSSPLPIAVIFLPSLVGAKTGSLFPVFSPPRRRLLGMVRAKIMKIESECPTFLYF